MIATATAAPFRFYLGTHRPTWLERTDVPLFVSRNSMPKKKRYRALGPWALDSAAFTEIGTHGRWTVEPKAYVDEVYGYMETPNLQWASIQDWMCEPLMLKKTGLTVAEHQRRTVDSYLTLRDLAPDITWAPVLQGWTPGEYLDCRELYERAGVDLESLPVVGVGSVCKRQNTFRVQTLIAELYESGLTNLHAFGFKVDGLTGLLRTSKTFGKPFPLASSDSLAWSGQGRHEQRPMFPECTGHKNCANCLPFALDWHERLMYSLDRARREASGGLFA